MGKDYKDMFIQEKEALYEKARNLMRKYGLSWNSVVEKLDISRTDFSLVKRDVEVIRKKRFEKLRQGKKREVDEDGWPTIELNIPR